MQENIGSAACVFFVGRFPPGGGARRSTKASALDPENRVGVLVLHDKAKLYLQLLGSTRECEDLFRLLRKLLQFGAQAVQRLIEGEKFFAVLFQKFAARVEGKPAFTRGQERKE